ncbi:hypothetical protein APP_00020 [Aeribacillus pallidus]|nr:hypothetical protein APP_00020 [Aeribacillus pallidus]
MDMLITMLMKGSTVYPHVDKLCMPMSKLFTMSSTNDNEWNALTVLLFHLFDFAAVGLLLIALKFFHEHE